MKEKLNEIKEVILEAARKARQETGDIPAPQDPEPFTWPINCTVGPGLEGAIASESKIGYVNGSKGWLVYRGYDIFDLCAYSTFEEVSYLLLHGHLPTTNELNEFKGKLAKYRILNKTLRIVMSFPVEEMNPMAALRLGTNMMRQEYSYMDKEVGRPKLDDAISSDEDSIPMETTPMGYANAIYEFKTNLCKNPIGMRKTLWDASNTEACYQLIAGVSTLTSAIVRLKNGHMPIEPLPGLSHAANLLYMMTGHVPDPVEERIMDIALILHADHGMNASTFASLVVASTLSDIYFSVGAGIAALNGPLHGGANEQVVHSLLDIGGLDNVKAWVKNKIENKQKIVGFGHRVYKAYDPRARILGPLAEYLVGGRSDCMQVIYQTAKRVEEEVLEQFGREKKIFPNVDFYSGIVYGCLGIPVELYTPIFAVSRVSGWTARVIEYLQKNRIFRPRAIYTGEFNKEYVPIEQRNRDV
ncbi:MAG: citrate/2-methylcitrate synthase [Candidatus Magnetoovum sp. WYHC-5]|nr:citrate/2-methylcitrate synthase [Candidatus Magnetoovum sp. WYHC-5]